MESGVKNYPKDNLFEGLADLKAENKDLTISKCETIPNCSKEENEKQILIGTSYTGEVSTNISSDTVSRMFFLS